MNTRNLLLLLLVAAVIVAAFLVTKESNNGARQKEPARLDDLIVLESPLPGDRISSPLVVRGKARGQWYFEATFPLVLTDWDGRIIAQSFAQAQSDWMTNDYVPFEGKIEFTAPQDIGEFSRRGALILQKSNPSGLPEHDAALEVEIGY